MITIEAARIAAGQASTLSAELAEIKEAVIAYPRGLRAAANLRLWLEVAQRELAEHELQAKAKPVAKAAITGDSEQVKHKLVHPLAPDLRFAPAFDAQYRGCQFFAENGCGEWFYVNHAGKWCTCPPSDVKAGVG